MTSSIVYAQDVKKIPCNFCGDSEEAVWFCRQCVKNLCDNCNRVHVNIPQCENHTVVSVSGGLGGVDLNITTTCKDQKSQLDLFCKTCDLKICVGCVTGIHKQHDFSLLTDYVKARKETFDEVCGKIAKDLVFIKEEIKKLESHLFKYKENMKDCRLKIQKVAKDKLSKIEEMKTKLEEDLNTKEKENVEKMELQFRELKNIEENHQKLLQSVGNHRLETVPSAFIDFMRNLEKEIKTLKVHMEFEVPFANQFVSNETDAMHLGSLKQIKSETRAVRLGQEVLHKLKSQDNTLDGGKQVPSLSSDLHLVASVSDKRLDCGILNIDFINDDKVWMGSAIKREVSLLEKGKVNKTVELPNRPQYTTVLTSGVLLVSCGTTIKQVSLEGVVSNFTDLSSICKEVQSLASTHQNEIFACLHNNKDKIVVVKLSREGKKILELDSRMFSSKPSMVSAAMDGTYFIRDDEKLVSINHRGEFVKNVKRTGELMNVRDIAVDRYGRIIGHSGDQVFVFGPDGAQLQTYNISSYKGIFSIYTLKADRQDKLWIGMYKNATVFKYLQ